MSIMDSFKENREFKNSLPKPKNAEGVIWAHSIAFCSFDVEDNLKRLLSILNKKNEISVTKVGEIDEDILRGRCGVYLKGNCTLMSTCDHSSIDLEDGERVPGICAESFFVEDYDLLEPRDGDYCECYLQPTEIVGFWAQERYVELIESEANRLGLSITIKR